MSASLEILHYTGYATDRGGIVAVLRALAGAGRFQVVHGVGEGFVASGPPMAVWRGPAIAGEQIGFRNAWRARAAAILVRHWLAAAPGRVFHGHSRAGLLVALWLHFSGEKRVVVTVHCYGKHRWFYRWAARILGARLFWLSPAMKNYYGIHDPSWAQCLPGCIELAPPPVSRRPRADGLVRLAGVGALVPWKNWSLVLAALTLLPDETRARLRFRHIGAEDGTAASRRCAEELREQAEREKLRGLVEWRGQQPSAIPLLQETDCLIVASRNEPFSVAMLEALGAGVPVLAADSGGAADLVRPGRNGWLFRGGDAADLARHLALLVSTDALARVAIDRTELERFSASVAAESCADIYRKLKTA